MGSTHSRRTLIKNIAFGASAVLAAPAIPFAACNYETDTDSRKLKGNINHAVCRWPYNYLSLEELCAAIKEIGFNAIDLLKPKDWPVSVEIEMEWMMRQV